MAKLKTKVVTGYVPLPKHPRKPAEYEKLGQQLSAALGDHPLQVYYDRVPDLWMTQFLEKLPPMENPKLCWNKGDNEDKNTLEYHCVQHQKFEWLWRAAQQDSEPDTFVWMDYGLTRLPGMNSENIRNFLSRIQRHDWAIPGCWAKSDPRVNMTLKTDIWPCWRFCGGLMVVPRGDIDRMVRTIQATVRLHVRITHRVEWEVNSMARAEPFWIKDSAFRWFPADHDGTMLTRY